MIVVRVRIMIGIRDRVRVRVVGALESRAMQIAVLQVRVKVRLG
jgi:hypothetical protein